MKSFISLLSLCAIVFGFSSCEKHDFETADLVGTWERSEAVEGGTRYDRLIFNEDGTLLIKYDVYSDKASGGGEANTRCLEGGCIDDNSGYIAGGGTRGTYTISGNTLYITSDFFDFFGDGPTTIAYKISIKKNTLKLTNAEELEKMKRKYVTTTTYTKVE